MLIQVGRDCKLLLAQSLKLRGLGVAGSRDLHCKEERAIHRLFIFNTGRHPDVTRAHPLVCWFVLYDEA